MTALLSYCYFSNTSNVLEVPFLIQHQKAKRNFPTGVANTQCALGEKSIEVDHSYQRLCRPSIQRRYCFLCFAG